MSLSPNPVTVNHTVGTYYRSNDDVGGPLLGGQPNLSCTHCQVVRKEAQPDGSTELFHLVLVSLDLVALSTASLCQLLLRPSRMSDCQTAAKPLKVCDASRHLTPQTYVMSNSFPSLVTLAHGG